MHVERIFPSDDAKDLIDTAHCVGRESLSPLADRHERDASYPAAAFAAVADAGLLNLAVPNQWGGGGQPLEVCLQVLEELASSWAAVAVAVSVHGLACDPLLDFGSDAQRQQWLPHILEDRLMGAFCLSESQAGSDVAAISCRAAATEDGYRVSGEKAWITLCGVAGFYTVFARTGEGPDGVSCFLVPAESPGMTFGDPVDKIGLKAIPTGSVIFDHAHLAESSRIGLDGQGLSIALNSLNHGRLGIAATAVGVAQAALGDAVGYAQERRAFGRRIIDHEGLGFLLADMAATVQSARSTYLDAARRADAGMDFSHQASIAKLVATDAAMKVTTDAVQVFGGNGCIHDNRVERYMREAKIMQIFEGTNQIQRLAISRHLADC